MRSFRLLLLVSIAVAWGLAACSPATPQAGVLSPLEATDSPLPTATMAPPPTVTPSLIELTILHTNDNWGETEPCG